MRAFQTQLIYEKELCPGVDITARTQPTRASYEIPCGWKNAFGRTAPSSRLHVERLG